VELRSEVSAILRESVSYPHFELVIREKFE
jgi:hypothetical protein